MTTRKKPQLIHGIKPYTPRKNETYMGTAQRAHFEKILCAWQSELTNETSNTVHNIQDETANHPDPTDRASRETDMGLELRGRDRDRKLLKKIDSALLALAAGDFGYCENCEEEIGLQRLEARPTAELCIDCKTLDEIREKNRP